MKFLFSAILLMFVSSSIFGATLDGVVKLKSRTSKAKANVQHTVVFYRPDNKKYSIRELATHSLTKGSDQVPAKPAVMQMINKKFDPIVMAVTVGTEIDFPNVDRVVHNAFSTTKKNEFDLGLYKQGESRTHIFNEPGVVKVFCNVHQGMTGHVLVLDTPYFSIPDAKGKYRIDDVQNGSGTVYLWHPQGKTVVRKITVDEHTLDLGSVRVPETVIKLTKRLIPKHKNKFGRSYRRNKNY